MSSLKYTHAVLSTEPQAEPISTRVFDKNLLSPTSADPFFTSSLYYSEGDSKHLSGFECIFSRCPAGRALTRQKKQSFTVCFVSRGSFTFNGEPMKAGDAAFIEPYFEDSPICAESGSEIYAVGFEGDITVHIAQMLRNFSSDAVYSVGFSESVTGLIDSMLYNKYLGEVSVKQLVIGFTDMLLAYLTRAVHPESSRRKPDDLISRAKSAIENSYADLTVEQLSNILYVNSKYLSKMFRKHLNTTPKQYITDTKLHHAEHYLLNTEYPIQKISEIVGYNNYSNFYIAFKAKYGVSPEDYRRILADHDAQGKTK